MMEKKKILFMGRKKVAARALKWLMSRDDVEIVGVLTDTHLDRSVTGDLAKSYGLQIYDFDNALREIKTRRLNFDLGLSVLYWRRLRDDFLTAPSMGVVNFHPAPLPDYKGVGGYNLAILHKLREWGVSAHFVNENIDDGDIIKVNKFEIDSATVTVHELESRCQEEIYALFTDTVVQLLENFQNVPRMKNEGGVYLTRSELESMKSVDLFDPDLELKTRAFWFPPYDGAYIEVNGVRYTLVHRKILNKLGDPDASSLFSNPSQVE